MNQASVRSSKQELSPNMMPEAMKNNNKKITKNKRFNRLKLISEGLPMPINRIKDCLNCFFNEKDVCKILKESKIYTITY